MLSIVCFDAEQVLELSLHVCEERIHLEIVTHAVHGRGVGGGGGGTQIVHGRSHMTTDPRTRTMPGRSTSGFHEPGRHYSHQARAKRREVFGESHEG